MGTRMPLRLSPPMATSTHLTVCAASHQTFPVPGYRSRYPKSSNNFRRRVPRAHLINQNYHQLVGRMADETHPSGGDARGGVVRKGYGPPRPYPPRLPWLPGVWTPSTRLGDAAELVGWRLGTKLRTNTNPPPHDLEAKGMRSKSQGEHPRDLPKCGCSVARLLVEASWLMCDRPVLVRARCQRTVWQYGKCRFAFSSGASMGGSHVRKWMRTRRRRLCGLD